MQARRSRLSELLEQVALTTSQVDCAVERQPLVNKYQTLVRFAGGDRMGPGFLHGAGDFEVEDVAFVNGVLVPRRLELVAADLGHDAQILEPRLLFRFAEDGGLGGFRGVHRAGGNLQPHERKVPMTVDQQVHLSFDGGGNVGEDFFLQGRARVHQVSRKPNLTRRLGILLDLEAADLESKLPRLLRERLVRELDPFDLDLVRVEPHARFDVRAPAKDDGTRAVLFRVEQRQEVPEGRSWTVVTKDPALRTNLKEALRWWANETIWVSDKPGSIDLPPSQFANVLRYATRDGLHVMDVSHYGLKVMDLLLDLYPDRVGFLPFEFEIFPPNEDDAKKAAEAWRSGIEKAFEAFCAVELKSDPAKPFALLHSQYYRAYLMPHLTVIGCYATEAETEKAAVDFRGLCFVVNLKAGSYASRWADR